MPPRPSPASWQACRPTRRRNNKGPHPGFGCGPLLCSILYILAKFLYNYKFCKACVFQQLHDRQHQPPSGRIGIYHSFPFSASMSSGSGKSFSTLLASARAMRCARYTPGTMYPCSMSLIVLWATPTRAASSACFTPFCLRRCRRWFFMGLLGFCTTSIHSPSKYCNSISE